MIVGHENKGWEIVSHYAHGLLAGKFAVQLDRGHLPLYWTDTLTAVIEHDDHLLDFDEREYLTEHGTPLDFTLAKGTDAETLEHAKRVFSSAMQKSQMIGLLVGRHLEFLYQGLSKDYEPIGKFLDGVSGLREGQRKLYGIEKSDEDNLYDMLRFCDRCSLILAQNKIPEVGRKLEINRTIKDKTYFISRDGEGTCKISPWPFHKKEFEIEFEYRMLEQTSFKNNGELKQALDDAEVYLRSFKFNK